MKTPVALALVACGMLAAAPDTARSAWQWQQSYLFVEHEKFSRLVCAEDCV